MSHDDLIKKQFDILIDEGRQVLHQSGWNGSEFYRWPSPSDFSRFCASGLNLIRRVCGPQSDHYSNLKRLFENKEPASTVAVYLPHCLGVVEAAKRDFETGLLFEMRSLITAEVLGDFIEQAEVLLEAKFHIPAASLIGAVLEDTLRKLCEKHDVAIPATTKIDRLNADLAKANVYDKLIQKRITALADIRNNADHGHFDKFKLEDVEDMVKWIRSFTADYLR